MNESVSTKNVHIINIYYTKIKIPKNLQYQITLTKRHNVSE